MRGCLVFGLATSFVVFAMMCPDVQEGLDGTVQSMPLWLAGRQSPPSRLRAGCCSQCLWAAELRFVHCMAALVALHFSLVCLPQWAWRVHAVITWAECDVAQ
jgi:hypothetical protein